MALNVRDEAHSRRGSLRVITQLSASGKMVAALPWRSRRPKPLRAAGQSDNCVYVKPCRLFARRLDEEPAFAFPDLGILTAYVFPSRCQSYPLMFPP